MVQPKTLAVKAALTALWDSARAMSETDSRELWSLLTALRGPDAQLAGRNDRVKVKHRTTCQLRLAIVGDEALIRKMGSIPRPIDAGLLTYDLGYVERACGKHFAEHVRDAQAALTDRTVGTTSTVPIISTAAAVDELSPSVMQGILDAVRMFLRTETASGIAAKPAPAPRKRKRVKAKGKAAKKPRR